MRATSSTPIETLCAPPEAMVTAALRSKRTNLPLEAPHPRFRGIVDDDTAQSLFGEFT